jgi:hypothetical protein
MDRRAEMAPVFKTVEPQWTVQRMHENEISPSMFEGLLFKRSV